jgi:hypothetical protein
MNHAMTLVLDFNVELYPLKVGDSFALALSSSLTPEGEKESGIETQSWRIEEGKGGLADEYEYVMYGKVRPLPFCTIQFIQYRVTLIVALLSYSCINSTRVPLIR